MNKERIYGIAGTVAVHLVVLLVFLYTFLTYPPKGWQDMSQIDEQEIVFEPLEELYAAGDFVRTGDVPDQVIQPDEPAPSNVTNNEPTQVSRDAVNAGQAARQPKVTTAKHESPAKVKEEPKGPTKEELEQERKRQEAKQQQQTRKNVAEATAKAFGGGKGKGTSGDVAGNSKDGNVTGTPGNGLSGRSLEHWTSVKGKKLGTIAVRVRVDSNGNVVSASYSAAGSSGTVAGDQAMRNACVQRSRECRFSVLEGSPVQSGTITWVFK